MPNLSPYLFLGVVLWIVFKASPKVKVNPLSNEEMDKIEKEIEELTRMTPEKAREILSPKYLNKLIEMTHQGASTREIAAETGISRLTVAKIIKKLGMKSTAKPGRKKKNPKSKITRLTHFREKNYTAWVSWPDGSNTKTKAWREGKGTWIVGGDVAKATTDLGGKIFIHINGKIYWLKGSRLIFQDNEKFESDI